MPAGSGSGRLRTLPEQITHVLGAADFSRSSFPERCCRTAMFTAFRTGNDEGMGRWDDGGKTGGWEDDGGMGRMMGGGVGGWDDGWMMEVREDG